MASNSFSPFLQSQMLIPLLLINNHLTCYTATAAKAGQHLSAFYRMSVHTTGPVMQSVMHRQCDATSMVICRLSQPGSSMVWWQRVGLNQSVVRQLVLGWVTIHSLSYICTILVFNLSPRPTQPSCPSLGGQNGYQRCSDHCWKRSDEFGVTAGPRPQLMVSPSQVKMLAVNRDSYLQCTSLSVWKSSIKARTKLYCAVCSVRWMSKTTCSDSDRQELNHQPLYHCNISSVVKSR